MNTMTCVLRNVRGLDQYIPLADAVNVTTDERVFVGTFTTDTVKDGPSGSHTRTICLPTGTLRETTVRQIGRVFREVRGVTQWVPMSEVPFFTNQERVFFGDWQDGHENDGPAGSHRRTVSTPVGQLTEKRLTVQAPITVGVSADGTLFDATTGATTTAPRRDTTRYIPSANRGLTIQVAGDMARREAHRQRLAGYGL